MGQPKHARVEPPRVYRWKPWALPVHTVAFLTAFGLLPFVIPDFGITALGGYAELGLDFIISVATYLGLVVAVGWSFVQAEQSEARQLERSRR